MPYSHGRDTRDTDGITKIRDTGDLYPSSGVHLKSTPGNVAKPYSWEGSGENCMGDEMGLRSGCAVWREQRVHGSSALTAGMRCLASRAALPRALEYSHFGRGQVSGGCAAAIRCGDASVGLNRGGSLVVEAAHLIVRHERREHSGSAADERKRL